MEPMNRVWGPSGEYDGFICAAPAMRPVATIAVAFLFFSLLYPNNNTRAQMGKKGRNRPKGQSSMRTECQGKQMLAHTSLFDSRR